MAALVVQAPVLPLYFLCVCRVGLTRIQLCIFCSKSWLMVNGLCYVALPYPNTNYAINDLAKKLGYIEADLNVTLW
jgi:hypothetical protein